MQNYRCLKTLSGMRKINLKNKRVLLRADFNVPINPNGKIDNKEDWRIKAVLPTINFLLKQEAKIIILTHLGRPNGKIVESLRLKPVRDKLSKLLGIPIKRMPDCIGKKTENAVAKMRSGEVLMLENLRFYREEEKNDDEFSKKLAKPGDLYVNDAFSDCHRKHSSIVGITKFLPSYAGFLLEKEIKSMNGVCEPRHPAIAIIGGAKLETKLPAVTSLARNYDYVLVGGAIANEIIKPPFCSIITPNVILPIRDGFLSEKVYDIGRGSLKIFSKFIQTAKTIIWNGPMGMFENRKYQEGTKGIIKLIKAAHKRGAIVLIGGGETIYAVQKFAPELVNKKIKNFNISTGGGAMLEFLAGKKLPGIEALLDTCNQYGNYD